MYGKKVTIHSNYQSISGIVVVFFLPRLIPPILHSSAGWHTSIVLQIECVLREDIE